MAEPLLRVEGVSKRFGGLLAVDNVSLNVEAGRITALIGPNGAGKTTLFAMISGFLTPSSGRIHHRGEDITGVPPYRLARRGIARTFQIVRPFAGLTVHENIAVGAHLSRRSRAAARDAAAQVARMVGLAEFSTSPPRASRSRAESGWSSPARWRRSPASCCSTKSWPGSIQPSSPPWCRPSAPSPTAASPL